ncbi:MAG: homoserine O-acetyltransferase [Bacteroidota bacterium]|nr:homoserine O-acetyltransferase [Bacteroidota bacterium]
MALSFIKERAFFMHSAKYIYQQKFDLECGRSLPGLTIAYSSYGKLNENRDNVIYVCHALTANSEVAEWWPHMVGEGLVFDTNRYFIVCANVLGSCYGTTGPGSINPETNEPYSHNFPLITIRDIVRTHQLLVQHLAIKGIQLICGGSLGGQQVIEWSVMQPDLINNAFFIATNARHSAWGIAFNEAQRMALMAGEGGLEAARAIAMLSYRNYNMYDNTQTDDVEKLEDFRAATYQRYQGQKLKNRFDADSYLTLSKAMDTHHVGRGRNSVQEALAKIKAKTLVVGISSDILFPVSEQKFLADNISGAVYREIDSPYGHDGFLIETGQITELLRKELSI